MLIGGLLFALSAGCASLPVTGEDDALLGVLTRKEIEASLPDWLADETPEIDFQAAMDLALTAPATRMDVYFGSWCSDSRREIARFWQALDAAGGSRLEIRYIGVDRDKEQPAELLAGVGLLYVPTFVVFRDEQEVGRVIEESPGGIEIDLLRLLRGEASGVVSVRDDVGAERPANGGSD